MGTIVYYKKGKGPNRDGTSLAEKYAGAKAGLLSIISDAHSGDQRSKAMLQREVSHALRKREVGPGDVQGVPILNNMSVQYAPGDLIGLELVPTVMVDKISGVFQEYAKRDRLLKKRTRGRGGRSESNEADTNRTQRTYSCVPDQLSRYVEMGTVLNQDMPLNELLDLVEDVNHDLAFNRELLISGIVTNTATYAASNRLILTAGTRWDESAGNMIKNLNDGIAALWSGKGSSRLVAWCSTEVWNVVKTNPDLLNQLALGDRGMVSPAHFIEIFGLDGLLISDARQDTANIGQSAVYSRIWGNNMGVMRVSETPQIRNAAFGYTFRWSAQGMATGTAGGMVPALPGGVFSQMWYDHKTGPIGAYHYKRSHYEDIVVVAADAAFLWKTPIAE